MMPSLVGTNMGGVPHHHIPGEAYTVDTILNELSRQLIGNTRRYSRSSNGQQRVGNAMRISKPGSANNSPRSSAMQARRRTLIGDGFRGGLQTRSPAMDQAYQQTRVTEAPSESFYEQEVTRPARPLSWHPSSQNAQQSLFTHGDGGNAMVYPYPTYSDAEILASLHHLPPTPAVYSGYSSPADSFSPLSLPYSNSGSSQQICSPVSQPVPTPQQQLPPAAFPPVSSTVSYAAAGTLSSVPYLPPARVADEPLSWEAYASTNGLLNRHTAPPTPEDLTYSTVPQQAVHTRAQQLPQQQQPKQDPVPQQAAYQPLIVHDDQDVNDNDEPEGEILYGMGLYDPPAHPSKGSAGLHESVVFSLLGGTRGNPRVDSDEEGLGLKLEDAWEPPASEDEDDDDQEDGDGDDGEGERE